MLSQAAQRKTGAALDLSRNKWIKSSVANSMPNYKRKVPTLGAVRAARRNFVLTCPVDYWSIIKVGVIFHWLWYGKNIH